MKTALLLLIASLACAAPAQARMTVTSANMKPGTVMALDQVFDGFGCSGRNVSPQLSWTGAPTGTRSFAVMAYDADAPTGSGWWHWVAFDIPAKANAIPAGASRSKAMPEGTIEARSDFGTTGYGGACPPVGHGVHHYRFTVFALSIEHLPADAGSPAAMIGFQVRAHTLAQASLVVTYSR